MLTSDGTLVRVADEVQAAVELGLDEIDARVISSDLPILTGASRCRFGRQARAGSTREVIVPAGQFGTLLPWL